MARRSAVDYWAGKDPDAGTARDKVKVPSSSNGREPCVMHKVTMKTLAVATVLPHRVVRKKNEPDFDTWMK